MTALRYDHYLEARQLRPLLVLGLEVPELVCTCGETVEMLATRLDDEGGHGWAVDGRCRCKGPAGHRVAWGVFVEDGAVPREELERFREALPAIAGSVLIDDVVVVPFDEVRRDGLEYFVPVATVIDRCEVERQSGESLLERVAAVYEAPTKAELRELFESPEVQGIEPGPLDENAPYPQRWEA